ncbi:hypothetical protein Ddye_011326 [Dipteronia dyeriana]|uniref:Uncharacterized protein n=1 Tax=Dipteronia dyeriana TaxID=168575 RepID=A0AAD9X2C3_9ROSI|nr:hypothetical protein Ddye_011326 [Dipteronia dyeriana]
MQEVIMLPHKQSSSKDHLKKERKKENAKEYMEVKALAKVPVVDFSKEALIPGSNSWLSACNEVRHALEEYG